MSTTRRSLRFVAISLAIISLVSLGIAANWTGVPAFNFFSLNETAAEASPTPVSFAPTSVIIDPAGAGGFESGVDMAANGWTVVNNATNKWFAGTATFSSGTQSAYISNTSGTTYAYTNTVAATSHFYRDVTVPPGEGNITLSFKLKGDGDVSGSTFFDKLMVYTAPTSFTPPVDSPVSPSTTLTGATLVYAQNANFGAAYATQTVQLPSSLAGTTFRLIFTFEDDTSTGTVPSSVDNISLTSVPLVPVTGIKNIPGDYPSITAAISDVNTNGVGAGGVTFNLTNGGTYIEDLPCLTAEGTGGNPIIFKKSGAGANAIISPTGTTGTTDSGVCIQGGDFITFDGVDITTTSSLVEYGYLVKNISATNGAQNNTIKNTSISLNRANTASIGILQSATTTGGGLAPTNLTGSNLGNKYYNLTVQNVYTGVYLLGTAAFPDDLNEVGVTGAVTKNVIGGTFLGDIGGTVSSNVIYGIRAASQSNAKIFNNEIRNLQSASTGTVAGIHVDNSGAVTAVSLGTTQIYNNEIHDFNAASTTAGVVYGIRANLTGNAGSVSKIYNNFIYGLNSSSTATTRRIVGIFAQDAGVGTGATHNVHYNSVRIASNNLATTSTCFEIGGAGATNPVYNVRDNIFANFTGAQTVAAAKHYTWVTSSTTTIGTGAVSDFNVLHINNPVNGFIGLTNTTDRVALTDWQTAVTQDANSKSQNPRFLSPTNLHITLGVATPVENGGTPIPSTTTLDFDGDTRTGNSDIGADEGAFTVLVANDIEATIINTPANGSSAAVGAVITPQAVFSNVGSANQTSVGVKMDITGPGGYSYTNNQSIATLNAGQSFAQSFTAAPAFTTGGTYTATATNLFADSNTANDVVVSTFTVSAPITGGAINVGTGQPYTSLTNPGGVFDTINTSTVASNITVNVTSDLLGETGAISLNQFAAGFTLTVQASGGARTISGPGNGTFVINLNGADGVTFNGVPSGPYGLTIRNTNTGAGGVFRFINDASNDVITSCLIEQNNSNSTAVTYSTGTATGNDNDSITNSIVRGTSPAIAPFNGIFSSASAAFSNGNLIVSGNQVTDFGQAGILMSTGTDNYTVSGNDVSQRAPRIGQFEGIFANTATGVNTISGNKIHGLTSNSSSFTIGIIVGNAGTLTISQNVIYDFQTTAGATGAFAGVYNSGATGTTPTTNLVNNFISIAPTISSGQQIAGIQDNPFLGNIFNASHNSIYIGGTATGGATFGMLRSVSSPDTATVRNNIFFNNRSGGGTTSLAIADESGGTGTWSSNGNFFAGTGATTAANFFDYNGIAVPFATWQTGPPTRDANSFAGVAGSAGFIPANIFVNAATTDLHILPTASNVIGSAITGTGVTTDIDGDPRPASNPDIGADEIVQAVGGVIPAGTFYNVSAAAGDSLGGNVTVTNALYLNGILATGASTLTVNCTGTVSGASPTSYINGNLQKQFCVAGVKGFEVGTANGYSPVSANVTAGTFPSTLTVTAVQGPQPNLNAATSLQRYWTLTEGGDITANLNFNYLDPTDILGTEANYRVIRVSGGTPVDFPNNCPTPGATQACVDFAGNQATVNGVSNFSDWTLGAPLNSAPTITAVPATVTEGSPVTAGVPVATVTDDGGNGTPTVTVNGGATATVNGVTVSNVVNTGGSVTANIVAACGATTATFSLVANDGTLNSAPATLTVTVTPNPPPTLTYSAASVASGGSGTQAPATSGDNGVVTYSIQNNGGFTGTLSVNSAGVVSYGAAAPSGLHNIVVRATDACGAGTIFTDATFALTVSAPNAVTVAGSTGANGDYPTLKAAFDAINANPVQTGLNISVTIFGDTDEGTATAALNAGDWATISVNPTGTRTVTGATTAGNPLVDLNGADNVTIDGSAAANLTFSNTTASATAGTSTIRLVNGATNDTIKNTTILGSSTSSTATAGGNVLISTSSGGANSGNTITLNNIGPAGANLPSKGVMSLGSASPNHNTGNSITGNNIFDFFNPGITVAGISISTNTDLTTISNNHLYQTAPRAFTTTTLRYNGILFSPGATGSGTISGNVIGFGAANGTGTTTISGLANTINGIQAPSTSTTVTTSIQNNTVSGFAQTTSTGGTTTSSGFIGINVGATAGAFNIGGTTGNTIGSLDASSGIVINNTTVTTNTWAFAGIFNFSFQNLDVISNNNIGTIMINNGGSGTGSGLRGIRLSGTTGQNVTISNNTIGGTAAGSITDNVVGTYNIYGIESAGGANLTATGNVIRNMSGNAQAAGFISMSGIIHGTAATGSSTISRNTIHSLTDNAGTANGAIYSMYLAFPAGQTNVVERNFIHSINVTGTNFTSQNAGILAAAGNATYKNNMVRLGVDASGASITGGFTNYGIFEIAGTNNFYNNTVYIGGSGVVASGNTFAFVSNVITNTRNYIDNIFWNARSNASGTGKNYAITVSGTGVNPAGLTSNYNDLYASGTGGFVGSYGGDQATLANWQAATGQDANSISADPVLINPTGTAAAVNLHLTNDAGPASNIGTPVAGVTNDFDNDARSATIPDIGADEVAGAVANLGITKTDGVTSVTAGGSTTYTIVASNAGPDSTTATVADTMPAGYTATWTCVGAGGGTCTAAGSGNINDNVTLPSGGSVTYTVSGTISAAATGSLSNTATVTITGGASDPNPGNNTATDTDTIGQTADLAITKGDGVTEYLPGGTLTYTITASNAGPSNVTGATVADSFPAAFTLVNWTCSGAGGGTCTASGSGNINNTVNLPSGGSVTFVATATVSGAASGPISNTATVTAPAGVTDPTPGNNSATDTDSQAAASIQFASALYREDESQTAQIRITRTIDTSGTTTVTFKADTSVISPVATGGNTGDCSISGVDFEKTTQTITFNPTDTEKFATVKICGGDTMHEIPDETIALTLSNPSPGSALGNPSAATLNINDTASQYMQSPAHDPIPITFASTSPSSSILVSGAPNLLGSIRVTLYDFYTANPDNIDVLLVGPQGQKYMLMADVGGNSPIVPGQPVTLTFSDFAVAAGTLPDGGPLATGQFLPTTCEAPTTTAFTGAPAPPYVEPGCTVARPAAKTMFGVTPTGFGNTNPNGTWKLFVRDDAGVQNLANAPDDIVGEIAGGWGLEILAPTAAGVSASGRVLSPDSRGVTNATISVTGNSLVTPITVKTGRNGQFIVEGLTAGETYVFTVRSRRFSFINPSRVITLTDNVTDIDFQAGGEN